MWMAWFNWRLLRGLMALARTRGRLEGCGAVVGGEVVAGPEPAHVARVADDDCGHHGADAVDLGHRRLGRRHSDFDALSRGGDGRVEAAEIGHELAGLGLALG